ncbi:hypothetical protein [Tenacibaculum maritimum]|uniref:hypothetical protein n=1 Tax=Tenacibaculum maritimum TaxID=107401 RepID=UPI001E330C83|nr:hypothetical protein [Tenacibaculum maritimum]MCD9563401.1 hypothetical protein [Tenacibaculum maritimum]MCD9566969.1 hypothetical protein [Tenacibaculum maritimum]MCD9579642.1 hypothetical protein [Tenacibaculum maritimum]MCD9597020.1 hypothetical protein [Tenacibaculum maritimum]MCD9614094.1 hypothetical protein [Tenacibaculum maritimum]
MNFEEKHQYLVKNIYDGLTNLNTGFDSPYIYYFNESDFEIILDRVEKHNITISGIEPWKNDEYYDVRVMEEYPDDKLWYRKVFEDYKALKENLQYAASYLLPNN